ncbi:MAG TPA: SusD/RagB family nutrient-binding outer membrane lipoprotein [Flavisolibacter sp.]|nr:SusD/RagB family nutrient-binding outer membrane lipoprotein [Flavisolibacter sp.]
MKKITIYSTILFLTIVGGGCKKYLDINQNPNAAEEPPINGLLAEVTYATTNNVFNASNYTSYYTQYLSSPNAASDVDTYNNVNSSSTWTGFYDVMTDLYDMRRFGLQKGLNAYAGVSDILMALHINMATNLWGDIPYSEAFQGVKNLTPKFDNQKSLFDTCINLLDRGISELQQPDADGELDKASDFIHSGNASAWIKTAHALKARMYTQLTKTNSYDPNKVLTELASAYTSNSDDAQVTAFQVRNPWAQVAVNNAGLNLDGWLSSYFVNATNGTTYGVMDPRLPLIATLTKYNDYRGTPNGKGRTGSGTNKEESYLGVGLWYSADNSPFQIITYAECKFMEAEADFRKNDKASAYAAYLAGINANMQKMGVPSADAQAYINNPSVSVGADNLTLQLILKEKYVAIFLSPVTWDDMRRNDYNYKNFTLPLNVVTNTFIRRMNYPVNEISTNGKNVPSVVVTDKLWWDQ